MPSATYYLKKCLQAAHCGDNTKLLSEIARYETFAGREIAESSIQKLYEILAENIEHNIRRDIYFGLGTDENPRYSRQDLVKAHRNLEILLEIKPAWLY
ncbi:hypothetical protein KY320_02405 [Candidatus Woesearchaeota archaeon]|nr:hypothetical protein [Candidatus Woesearchaeota archaeon]